MRTDHRRVELPVSEHEAYEFLRDHSNDRRWRDELIAVTLKSGEPGQVGATYEVLTDWNGLRSTGHASLVELEAASLLHFRSDEPGARVDSVYHLSPREQGCYLDIDLTLDCKGGFILVEPFAWAILTRWADADLPHLAEVLAHPEEMPERSVI